MINHHPFLIKRTNQEAEMLRKLLLPLLLVIGIAAAQAVPEVQDHLLVTTDWLAEHLDNPDVVILHVAEDNENYSKGHIPGAYLVTWKDIVTTRAGIPNELPPVEELVKWVRKAGIDKDRRIVIYDETGGIAAARTFLTLDYLGLGDQAALLDGHLIKWKAENRKLSTQTTEPTSSSFEPELNQDMIINLQAMQEKIRNMGEDTAVTTCIIDARSEEDYSGEKENQRLPRTGHISGATNIHWMKNIESEENPVLKPVEELRKMYSFPSDAEIITYCTTGRQASHDYFVARYLGYQPKLYDGSFIEWSQADETEVEK
jgi:thiosulfate/3-mercaptopyruvate sulfurtransferase